MIQYRDYLTRVESATDHETATALGWPMGTVCSVRNGLLNRGLVIVAGFGLSPYGKKVTRWRLKVSIGATGPGMKGFTR